MKKVKALVFSGYGLNCEEETKYAFELAGARADIVHINDLIDNPKLIKKYQIMAFPGGFSYGDDTGSGNAFAQKVKNHLWEEAEQFVKAKKLVIGICNGFQILSNLGLLPALNFGYGERQVALLHNESARYSDRWVDLKVENNSPWLVGINTFSTAISHGEGKLFADEKTLRQMKAKNLIALKYFQGEICDYQHLPSNPNGAIENIAGITDESGRVFGLMPHPERGMFFTQLPNWPFTAERLKREGKGVPKSGPGLKIFQNAAEYFK